ncbi:GNAT family N-acetyltransferase [Paraburkholderia strydomiana]|uniref:GNAT family N-acetyltransferase n=1 Tax=Paraburkholderia strydomiana TaxID=1245417 RepID=UPI0038B78C23
MSLSAKVSLDNPVWMALSTKHAHLGRGGPLARRYDPDVAPFAAVASETTDAYQALHRLLEPHEYVVLQSLAPLTDPDGLKAKHLGTVQQMVAGPRAGNADRRNVIRLGASDVPEMLDLAQRAKPGPFGKRTREMGNYIGIREGDRLIAMAGERMALNRYVEVSAVCVDEQWRGHGLAGRLVNVLCEEIVGRGDTPFLHVFHHNATAIGLYERLGFVLRCEFILTQISPVAAAAGGR